MTLIYNTLSQSDQNNFACEHISGNLFSDISDHVPNFLLYDQKNTLPNSKQRKKVRIYSKTNIQDFENYLNNKDTWANFMTSLIGIIKQGHDKCFPLQMVSQKRLEDKNG